MDVSSSEDDSLGVFSVIPTEVIVSIIAKSRLIDVLQVCKVSRGFRNHAVHPAAQLKHKIMKLTFFYIDTKQPLLAIAALETAINLFPDHPDLYKELGCGWMDLVRPTKALAAFKRGVEVSEGTSYGNILKAQVEWALGHNEEAWKWADLAVKADPSDPRSYHFRAFMQSSLAANPEDKSSQMIEIADYLYILENLTSYGRISIIHNNLGYVYYEMKQYDKAINHFAQSIAMCPHHAQTYYNKAVCLADQGQMAAATKCCEAMIAINPNHADAHSLRGWIHISQGQVAEGIKSYRTALDLQRPIESYSIIVFCGGLVGLNRFAEAEEYVTHLIPGFELQVAKLKRKIENIDTLISDPTSRSEILPQWQNKLRRVHASLGVCYRIQGEIDLALGRFNRVPELYRLFLACMQDQQEATRSRTDTPLLRYGSKLNFKNIRRSVVDIVLEYHKRRESGDPEESFRSLQEYVYPIRFDMNEDEQKYLIACIGHFFLSLFWEGDQFVEMLEGFWKHWETRDPGFLVIAAQPHLLINLFDLATRTGNGVPVQMIFQAFVANDGAAAQLRQALEQLGLIQFHQHALREDDDDEDDLLGEEGLSDSDDDLPDQNE
jgi:tetratricopeptide (TPR) repeat protein